MEFAFIANRIIELTLETFTVGVGFILGIALFFASIIAFQLFLESCFKVKNFLNKKLKADVKCGGVCRTEARMDKEKAKLYIDIAEKYLKKYGKDNAHERIKDSIDILHEFYKDGNDIGNSIGILVRIDAIILQEKA